MTHLKKPGFQSLTKEDWHYGVFVLPSDDPGSLRWFPLGEITAVDQLIATFREVIGKSAHMVPNREVSALGKELYRVLFSPFRAARKGRETILVSPYAEINLLPLGGQIGKNTLTEPFGRIGCLTLRPC